MMILDPKHSNMVSQSSAKNVVTSQQVIVTLVIVICCMVWSSWKGIPPLTSLVSFFSLITSVICMYSILLMLLALIPNKNHMAGKAKNLLDNSEAELPVYTILVPLYKEAEIFAQLLSSLLSLDYPQNKLDIIFLLEADDQETRDAVKKHQLPSHFRLLIVPAGYPRTKPRACNFGLLHAYGEYLVIYDVEDRPEPDQLRKVLDTFRQKDRSIFCVQCRLNYYNIRQNVLTRLFTLEYSFWFDLMLMGLSILGAPVPLGGTSNHFRTENLRKIGGWDAYNVTEDCDLGMRIAIAGYQTVVIDSTTWEEANSQLQNWIRQRSRWMKGYIQTYLVHMRNPVKLFQKLGVKKFLSFQLIVGGAPLILLCAPLLWIMPVFTNSRSIASIQSHYDVLDIIPLLLYIATFLFLGICGALVRRNYDLLGYALLFPVYYALQSYAAWKGFYQLFTKPHYWEKTQHGLWK